MLDDDDDDGNLYNGFEVSVVDEDVDGFIIVNVIGTCAPFGFDAPNHNHIDLVVAQPNINGLIHRTLANIAQKLIPAPTPIDGSITFCNGVHNCNALSNAPTAYCNLGRNCAK